nr:alpha/beta hydrolase [Plastoroseomonas arctica]
MQDRLIYAPYRSRPDLSLAALHGIVAGEVITTDGVHLLTWSIAPSNNERPVFLYLHGIGGNLMHRARRLERFAALGWGVLMVEWRGYGGNTGRPSEQGFMRDARAGLVALQVAGHAPNRIVLWAESLGTAIAIEIAAEQPTAIAAVLLELPFTSLLELAQLHYPWLPARLLLRDRFDALGHIARVTAPILIMSGGRDTLVPRSMGLALFAAARAPTERWEAPESGHEELGTAGAVEVAASFLDRHADLR